MLGSENPICIKVTPPTAEAGDRKKADPYCAGSHVPDDRLASAVLPFTLDWPPTRDSVATLLLGLVMTASAQVEVFSKLESGTTPHSASDVAPDRVEALSEPGGQGMSPPVVIAMASPSVMAPGQYAPAGHSAPVPFAVT